jgi:uncharacterized membrane protein YeaQ/YmgE (transglycosylase-associated protein family)
MEDWLVQILVAVVVGAVIGGIARILLPGVQRVGMILTIVAGAVAAYAGYYIADAMGLVTTEGIDWAKLGIQVLLAMLVIGTIGGVGSRRA